MRHAGATRRALLAVALGFAALAAGCSGFPGSSFWSGAPPPPPAQSGTAIGTGQVKVGLILPLSASGNAGLAAQQAAQQAIGEGAEIILGPLFAHSVGAAAQIARARGVPLIAFSTDANVAANGVYLLSFLPESED